MRATLANDDIVVSNRDARPRWKLALLIGYGILRICFARRWMGDKKQCHRI